MSGALGRADTFGQDRNPFGESSFMASETSTLMSDMEKTRMNVFERGYDCPSDCPADLKDLFDKIFELDMEKRITIDEIKVHPFFVGVPWINLANAAKRNGPCEGFSAAAPLGKIPQRKDIAFKNFDAVIGYIRRTTKAEAEEAGEKCDATEERKLKERHDAWVGTKSCQDFDFSGWDYISQHAILRETVGKSTLSRRLSLQTQKMMAKK